MEQDSSQSMNFNQLSPQQSPVQSFQCSHCVLIFRSKRFLFEHLSMVHGLDVDSALINAGYQSPSVNVSTKVNKTVNEDIWVEPSAKKLKSNRVQMGLQGSTVNQNKSSGRSGFMFEVSEDEEEKGTRGMELTNKAHLVSRNTDNSHVYQCKHCSYSDTGVHNMLNHYEKVHPYVRCNNEYIQDPNNRSATLRCLECPVEFDAASSLERHYKENHPEAPNVFAMQPHEFHLIFKCFVCPFTTILFKELNEHYSEEHPTHTVNNLLMYYRYSANTGQEESSQPISTEKSSSLCLDRISVKKTSTPSKGSQNTPLQSRMEVDLYQCKNCTFSHKSAVAMLVHYQKTHPKEVQTIKKIKQEAFVVSDIKSSVSTERISESLSTETIINKSATQHKPISDSSMKSTDQSQLSSKKRISLTTVNTKTKSEVAGSLLGSKNDKEVKSGYSSLNLSGAEPEDVDGPFFCQFCNYTDTTIGGIFNHQKTQHGILKRSAMAIYVSKQVQSKAKKSTGKLSSNHTNEKSSHETVDAPPTSLQPEVFYCQFCSYSNHNVRSVVGHQGAKHGKNTTVTKTFEYSLEVQKKKAESSVELNSPSPKKGKPDHKEQESVDPRVHSFGAYRRAENLFFCEKCNFGHPSILGVMKHQCIRHPDHVTTNKKVLRYTEDIRGQIKKSKSQATYTSFFSTGLPLPLVNEGDEEVLFCPLCNFAQKLMTRVMSHQHKRHPGVKIETKYILEYSAMVHEEIQKSRLKTTTAHQATEPKWKAESTAETNSHSSEKIKPDRKDQASTDCQVQNSGAYGRAENLYFCEKCNFGHTSTQGVLKHQTIRHPDHKATAVKILRYTAELVDQIKKSISQPTNSSRFSPSLPLPLVGKDYECMLFCPLCNFSHKSMIRVLDHQRKRHSGFKAEAKYVLEYSCMVREQIKKSGLETANQEAKPMTHGEGGSETTQTCSPRKLISVSFSSAKKTAKLRSLQCPKCLYSTPHLYLMKRHLRKIHLTNDTIMDVLQMAFNDGVLKAGYHCEWCVFSHKKATRVHQHCQEKHARRGISLEHISARLYIGPKAASKKKKKLKLINMNETNGPPVISPIQQSGKVESETFPCRACPFKGDSSQAIISHYRAVHPWSVKEDGSDMDDINFKEMNVSKSDQDTEGHSEMPPSFETYQVPIEFETLSDPSEQEMASTKWYKCHFCHLCFTSHRGLRTHYRRKHPDFEDIDSEEKDESHVGEYGSYQQVYKCPCCTYVNNSRQGILTHCQMMHPKYKSRADKLQTTKAELPNMGKYASGGDPRNKFRFGGYMCKKCSVIKTSLKKLKMHYEKDHSKLISKMLKPAAKHPAIINKKLLSRLQSSQSSILQYTYNVTNKKSATMKCSLCKYICNTKIGMRRHLRIYHKNASKTETQEYLYKCVLCSYSTYIRSYFARHYTRTHGKAAFLTYYVPMYKNIKKPQPSPQDDTVTQNPEDTLEGCRSDTLVMRDDLASLYKETHGSVAFNSYSTATSVEGQSVKYHNKEVGNLPGTDSYKGTAAVKCTKCTHLLFKSPDLLSAHYIRVHSTDPGMDFSMRSSPLMKGSKVYKCAHCSDTFKSIRQLGCHLDDHRELYKKKANMTKRAPNVSVKQPSAEPFECKTGDKLPELETVHELARWNVRKVETFILATSPPSSPPRIPETEELTVQRPKWSWKSKGARGQTCQQCGRTFKSLIGLRVHERSHAAMAVLEQLGTSSTSSVDHNLHKYIRHCPEFVKPFRCELCSYQTTILGLLTSHLLKKHRANWQEDSVASAETDDHNEESNTQTDEEAPYPSHLQEDDCSTEPQDKSKKTVRKPVYSEPVDVQPSTLAPAAQQDTQPPEDCLFHCEFCNFSTEHKSLVKRHYWKRHGKKLLNCKDCSFFTGLRKTLDLHIDTSHSKCQSEPIPEKDLDCPLCHYQTKNKNNMIDHVVLHREERLTPIEVRRPKLSRYLQGIIFQCHKCTFTSANAENLRLHILKHDDVSPYKCQLCYFDCSRLSELEAHLCDKHQVMRNHELVGQINLDQMKNLAGKVNEEVEAEESLKEENSEDGAMEVNVLQQEEKAQNAEDLNIIFFSENQGMAEENTNSEGGIVNDKEAPYQKQAENPTENNLREKIAEQNEEQYQRQENPTENNPGERIAEQNEEQYQRQENPTENNPREKIAEQNEEQYQRQENSTENNPRERIAEQNEEQYQRQENPTENNPREKIAEQNEEQYQRQENPTENNPREKIAKQNEEQCQRQENPTENNPREKIAEQNEEQYQRQEQDVQEWSTDGQANQSSAGPLEYKDKVAEENSVPEKKEQDTQGVKTAGQSADEIILTDAVESHSIENTIEQTDEENRAENKSEDKEEQKEKSSENQVQHKPQEEDGMAEEEYYAGQPEQEMPDVSSTGSGIMGKTALASKLQQKSVQDAKVAVVAEQSVDAKIEDDILNHILELEEESCISSKLYLQDQCYSEIMVAQCAGEKTPTKDIRSEGISTAERQEVVVHNSPQISLCHKKQDDEDGLDVPFMSCEEDYSCRRQDDKEPADPFEEMPVLENDYLSEGTLDDGGERHKIDEDSDSLEHKIEILDEEDKNQLQIQDCKEVEDMKETDNLLASNGAISVMMSDV
ncbi:zinc finger protein 462-like [Lampris incognitus]|uniref:zinc finger protein 462-like n=1 Tax=Lampris incognitus TaxID=2546036 RepID=UPI0024B5FD22|nr:zinc finger protein 462-like [Lampris incognitus]